MHKEEDEYIEAETHRVASRRSSHPEKRPGKVLQHRVPPMPWQEILKLASRFNTSSKSEPPSNKTSKEKKLAL